MHQADCLPERISRRGSIVIFNPNLTRCPVDRFYGFPWQDLLTPLIRGAINKMRDNRIICIKLVDHQIGEFIHFPASVGDSKA